MIQNLVQSLAALLQDSLQGSLDAPEKQIQTKMQTAPAADTLPLIALYGGKLTVSQKAVELNAGAPRPQEWHERFNVTAANQAEFYLLSHLPLQGSMRVRLITNPDELTERHYNLLEPQDFIVDYTQSTLQFNRTLPLNSLVLLHYSFPGIFTLKEFAQELLIDVFAADATELEQWSAIVIASLLTSQADLIEAYNTNTEFGYSGGPFAASSTLSKIVLLEIVPNAAAVPLTTQLRFQVQGQLKLTREMSDSAAIIKKVRSMGRVSDYPVNMEVGLE